MMSDDVTPPGGADNDQPWLQFLRSFLGPQGADEAIRAMEGSELVADTLGEHLFEHFLANKRAEFEEYRAQVTPFELQRYLPVL